MINSIIKYIYIGVYIYIYRGIISIGIVLGVYRSSCEPNPHPTRPCRKARHIRLSAVPDKVLWTPHTPPLAALVAVPAQIDDLAALVAVPAQIDLSDCFTRTPPPVRVTRHGHTCRRTVPRERATRLLGSQIISSISAIWRKEINHPIWRKEINPIWRKEINPIWRSACNG
jgi:hypothetical protein